MKSIIKTISVLLFLVILVVPLYSCYNTFQFGVNYRESIFPKGYTGGFIFQPGNPVEYYWVETYEEVLEAVELLKSHGSTFYNESFFVYEGDEFDVKYCFEFGGEYGPHKDMVPYGENPYDRWATNVYISSYIFLEDVTIDELVYSNLRKYDAYSIAIPDYSKMGRTEINNANIDEFEICEWTTFDDHYYHLDIYHKSDLKRPVIAVGRCLTKVVETTMTREDIYSILSNGYFENYYIHEDN